MKHIASTMNERSTDGATIAWACSNDRHLRVSARTATHINQLGQLCHAVLPGRFSHQVWIRYRLTLSDETLANAPTPARLSPINDALIDRLSRPPLHDLPQAQTARRLWQLGLRSGFVWIEAGKPLCLQWLFGPDDAPLLARLPEWSGMYPPLPPNHGQVENILTLPAGMRYPGGAASPFTRAMFRLAHEMGMHGLITHIHESNTAAHRWAHRTGWIAYGHIHRYQCDLPLLGNWHGYVHDTSEPTQQRPAAQQHTAA